MQEPRNHSKRNWIVAGIVIVAAIAAFGVWNSSTDRPANTRASAASDVSGSGENASTRDEATTPHHGAFKSRAAIDGPAPTPAPLPPPGTPLAKIYDELKARADAGDAEAASRLFTDLFRCATARDRLELQPIMLEHALNEDASKLGEAELRQRDSFLARMSEELQAARRNVALCDGLSDEQQQVTPVVLRAAQLGDPAAADCYIGGFPYIAKGLLAHPEWVTQYRDNAQAIAQTAITHGDWSMVAQLQQAYAQSVSSGLLGELTGHDAAQSYRYLRLQRLGAPDRLAPQLDREIAEAERGLPQTQMDAAAAWAEQTFQRFFAAHPERQAKREPDLCPE